MLKKHSQDIVKSINEQYCDNIVAQKPSLHDPFPDEYCLLKYFGRLIVNNMDPDQTKEQSDQDS